jgi:hypothetical protein
MTITSMTAHTDFHNARHPSTAGYWIEKEKTIANFAAETLL